MISQGYFKVDEETLRKVLNEYGLEKAKKLLYEMLNWGGRISYHEYEYWLSWLKRQKSLKKQKN